MITRGWVPELVAIAGGIYDDPSQPTGIEEKMSGIYFSQLTPHIIIVVSS